MKIKLSSKTAIESAATVMLVLVLAVSLVRACRKAAVSREKINVRLSGDTASFGAAKSTASLSGPGLYDELLEKTKNTPFSRDPFVLGGAGVREPSPYGLQLDGIVWDENTPLVMIGGAVLEKGDTIGGYLVVDIKPDRVVINDGSADVELLLGR